jgi:hypothetical protein
MAHFLVFVQVGLMIGSVFALCFACIPYNGIWDLTVPATCLDKPRVEISSAAIHLASDLCILALPQKVIWGLQMSLRERLGISLIFSAGILYATILGTVKSIDTNKVRLVSACTSAAFRLAVTVYYSSVSDVVYSVASVILWAFAEMTCGFLVLGLPIAPKFFVETGIISSIKASVQSWSGTPSNSSKGGSNFLGSQGTMSSKTSNLAKAYQKLDADGVPLKSLKGSRTESTEELRDPYTGKPDASIVRTTRVVTKEEFTEDSRSEQLQAQLDRQHPWRGKSESDWP